MQYTRGIMSAAGVLLVAFVVGCNAKVTTEGPGEGEGGGGNVTIEVSQSPTTEAAGGAQPNAGATENLTGITAEVEPNDDPKSANPVEFGKPFTAAIQKKDDKDWYKVSVAGQGYVRVRAKNVPEAIKPEVRFCTWDDFDGEKQKRHWHRLPDACHVVAGVSYIQMIDDFNDKSSPDSFTVMVDFIPEMDSLEFNDGAKTAATVAPGTVIQPAIYPLGDSDWYKVTAPDTGYLFVRSTEVPEALKPEIRFASLQDMGEVKELRHWHKIPDGCRVAKGDTYIQMIDDFSDKCSEKPFKLKIDYLAEFDAGEPNGTIDAATQIESGAVREAAIFPLGDSDWFKLTCSGQGYVEVKTDDVPGDLKPEVRFCLRQEDGKAKEIRHWHGVPDACPVAGGDVYVQLIDDFNDRFSKDLFKLRIAFIEEFDTSEPNNKVEEATPLNGRATMAIYPEGDADYFAVRATRPGKFRMAAATSPDGLKLEAALYDKGGKELAGWGALPRDFTIGAAGTYYVAVIDDFNDRCSRETFEISVAGPVFGGIPTVTVPNVVGKPYPEARSILGRAGLRTGPPSGGMRAMRFPVKSQSPAPGANVRRGTMVRLQLAAPGR